jgi:hypothetical protein
MLAVDASNFTVSPPPIAEWQAAGVGLVLIQAVSPNQPFPATQTRAQIEACAAAGLPTDVYLYLWSNSNVEADMQAKLGLLQGLEPSVRKVWLDVEDSSAASVATRLDTIRRALAVLDQWCADNGKPETGIYTALWWWTAYAGDTEEFGDRQLWTAAYDGVADTTIFTPFGGWSECALKQFAGSQPDGTDLDVLSDAEALELNGGPPMPEDPCADLTAQRDGLVVTIADIADRLGDLILAEAAYLKRPMRRWYVRSVVAQMAAERVEAAGPRP